MHITEFSDWLGTRLFCRFELSCIQVACGFYCVASLNSPMSGERPGKVFNPERTISNLSGNAYIWNPSRRLARSNGREPHAVGFRRSGAAPSDSGLTGSAIHQRGRDDPCGHVCGSAYIGDEAPLPSPGTAGCNAACGLAYWCFATLPLSSETKDCPAGVAFTAVPETISFALTSLP
jgi:hypothetical protein